MTYRELTGRQLFWTSWGALALAVPAFAVWAGRFPHERGVYWNNHVLSWATWAAVALTLGLVSGVSFEALHRLAGVRRVWTLLGPGWWAGLAAFWARFWWLDLHRARFAVVLLAVPLALLADRLTWRGRGPGPAFLLGVLLIWAVTARRASRTFEYNVSSAYDLCLLGTALLVFGAGPWALAAGRRWGAVAAPWPIHDRSAESGPK